MPRGEAVNPGNKRNQLEAIAGVNAPLIMLGKGSAIRRGRGSASLKWGVWTMFNPNFIVSAVALIVAVAFWFIWKNRAPE